MDLRRVFSSHINGVGYDPVSKELHVAFAGKDGKPGKTAVYMDVPADVAQQVTDAPSIGTALHSLIKGRFAHGYRS